MKSKTIKNPLLTQFTKDDEIVVKGRKSFVAVGLALYRIRDSQSYKHKYSTFEDYCQERHGWTRQRGNQLIDAAKVVGTLTTNVDTLNEAQARELGRVPEPLRAEVLEHASEGGHLTADKIRRAREDALPKTPLEQIILLYSQLSRLQGSPDVMLVQALSIIRNIGLLLEGMMGRKHAWKRSKFKQFESLPIDFDRCRDCLTLYMDAPNDPTVEDAAKYSEKIFQIMGKITRVKKPSSAQSSQSAAVVIFNALQQCRITVDKRMKEFKSLDDEEREEITKHVIEHREWIVKTECVNQRKS